MSEAERFVLEFDEETEEFNQTSGSGSIDTDKNTFLIIDENERKMTISYRAGISIVIKRTIERRVNSYSKTGFTMGDKRVGLGFPLEQVNADEKLPDILLTHGHTFGRRLERDEIPDYLEPEPNMDIVVGSAGLKRDVSGDTSRHAIKTDVSSTEPQETPAPVQEFKPEPRPVLTPAPVSKPKSEPTPSPTSAPVSVGKTVDLKANSSQIQSSDDAVWALGQFLDQFSRQGKVCVVTFEESGKFRLVTLKDSSMKLDEGKVEGNYRVDDVNLFEI